MYTCDGCERAGLRHDCTAAEKSFTTHVDIGHRKSTGIGTGNGVLQENNLGLLSDALEVEPEAGELEKTRIQVEDYYVVLVVFSLSCIEYQLLAACFGFY